MASTNYPAAGVNGNTYTSSTTGPYETTGANNVPYTAPNTGTTGTTGTTGLAGTSGTAAPATTTGGVVKEPGHGGIGGVFAKVHGAGEAVRGAFNSKVDDTFNGSHRHDEGVLKNNNVARAGLSEMDTGRFSENTKINEGVLPGNNGRRSEY